MMQPADGIMDGMVEPLSLYLHIPFCRVKCAYCDFNTYTGFVDRYGQYVTALVREIELLGSKRGRPLVRTVFIGGGTPTVLSIADMARILDACRRFFRLPRTAEITSEANPGTVDEAYLRELLALGINRLSFGAQSFNPAELGLLGRLHSAGAIAQTVRAARAAGATNLNLDLIYGLPQQTLAGWRRTLNRAIELAPDHVSLYALTLERGTPLRASVVRGELPQPDPDLAADMYELAAERLAAGGFQQYEISNWCRPGFECRHNLVYWRNQTYLGFGPGAHSSEGGRRWWNVRPVPLYMQRIAEATQAGEMSPATEGFEKIGLKLAMAETMMLGLRLTGEGVNLAGFAGRFGSGVADVYGQELKQLIEQGLLEVTEDCVRLTPPARLLANQVFIRFLPDD